MDELLNAMRRDKKAAAGKLRFVIPTRIGEVKLVDDVRTPREYRLFYRLEDGRYLLAVVKITLVGAFFASMYPTGRSIRPSHRRFRRVLP